MRLLILVALLVAYVAVTQTAVAQCADYAGCVGQVAEGGARLREFQRATAAVVATDRAIERAATSQAREMSASATELARPTRTPQPSVTSLPTQTPVPSATPQPTATKPDLNATAMSAVVEAIQKPQVTPKPVTNAEMGRRQTVGTVFIVAFGVVIVGGLFFLIRILTASHDIQI